MNHKLTLGRNRTLKSFPSCQAYIKKKTDPWALPHTTAGSNSPGRVLDYLRTRFWRNRWRISRVWHLRLRWRLECVNTAELKFHVLIFLQTIKIVTQLGSPKLRPHDTNIYLRSLRQISSIESRRVRFLLCFIHFCVLLVWVVPLEMLGKELQLCGWYPRQIQKNRYTLCGSIWCFTFDGGAIIMPRFTLFVLRYIIFLFFLW